MPEKAPFAAFAVSVAVLAAGYGVVAARNDWFPNPQITLALDTVADLRANWKNDVGLEPTRHLVPARHPGAAERFTVAQPDRVTPGFTLVAGLSRDQARAPFTVTLFDERGSVVHEWPIDYAKADPGGPNPLNTMLHGMEVEADGSLIATFDGGHAIARFDACGTPMWSTPGDFHHTISPDPGTDGAPGLLTWRGDTAAHVDLETGAVTDLVSIGDMIRAGAGQEGIIGIRTHVGYGEAPLTYESDPFHANDVETLTPEMAAAFPMFAPGDLLVSLREINMIAVADRRTGRFKWYQHGPWLKQHDPDFQPDGTITVFDNHTGSGRSRILRVDPKTHETAVVFAGSEALPFYSWQRGKHQVLPSGNILITEAQHGRVFEITADGALVWERDMGWDARQNLIVTEARHVAPDFFEGGRPRCEVTAAAEGGSGQL
ncbi:arylsulfotransferase family protein [Frigidibacter sp. MR17.14]|uniref:arylsulfotransferase family protein n=1 Tax=Frigidibacter sp. MR17.14 TaxID=3126509 RepID=UPI003012F1E2